MEFAFLKFVVLTCLFVAVLGQVEAKLDTQIPISDFQANTTDSCHDACSALVLTLGPKVHHNTSLPASLFSGYYTLMQRSAIPLCIIHPTSSEDVSTAIQIISQHTCIFAVKSGGHAKFAGGSTAPGGIVIDMQFLNILSLSDDRETAYVGTGNRWGEVYSYLDPFNVSVVGGRVGDVGVGGFLLGGGISFISRKWGWGCDNVQNFEVVLANGTISNISQATHPDLYFALRGGGKNFGIVTRFDLETHPTVPLWWGGFNMLMLSDNAERLSSLSLTRTFKPTLAYLAESAVHAINKLACNIGYCTNINDFTESIAKFPFDAAEDPNTTGYGFIYMLSKVNMYGVGLQMLHTGGDSNASALSALIKRVNTKPFFKTTRFEHSSGFVRELDTWNPVGVRMTYNTATFKVNPELLKEVIRIFVSEVEIVRHIPGFQSAMSMQTIARDEIAQFARNGGNALGIDEEDGPLTLILASFGWDNEEDNELVVRTAQNVIDRAVIVGKEMGVHHPYIYQNYAAKIQDVFGGYSVENQERLRRIQEEVDPQRILTKLQPGYFNL